MVVNNQTRAKKIKATADLLKNSSYAVAFTGAGISTASGIPDFRSPSTGLWSIYDPFEVASLTSFQNFPEKFYSWIKPLMITSRSTKPNFAHFALAKLEHEGIIKSIITQNIDGLHQEAGSSRVFELHGSINTATCQNCGTKYTLQYMLDQFNNHLDLPLCIKCRMVIKPDITLFEEMLPQDAWENAYQEIILADLVFVIGSSLEVFPASSLPEIAISKGAKVIINTISATRFDHQATINLPYDILETIKVLMQEF
jgi:NAD-dependent deacetylase